MFTEERRQMILSLLKADGRVLSKDLAERFNVSIDTVRRDLSIMEEEGLLQKTYGGAILQAQVRKGPDKPEIRFAEGTPYQHAIARIAASYVNEGDTIFLGGGSVIYVLARYLPRDFAYTVVTNSLNIARQLEGLEQVEKYMVCGKIKSSGEISDAFALEFVKGLRFDTAFETCAGISVEHGVTNATPETALFQRTVAEVARKRIILAPYHKIGSEFFTQTMDLGKVDVLITDWEASEEEVKRLREKGVKVVIASQE